MPNKIVVHCQNCGKKLAIAERHFGKKAQCPQCMAVMVLTRPKTAGPPQAAETVIEDETTQPIDVTTSQVVTQAAQETVIEEKPPETLEVKITDHSAFETVIDEDSPAPMVIEVSADEPGPASLETIIEPGSMDAQKTILESGPPASQETIIEAQVSPSQETIIEPESSATLEVVIPREPADLSGHETIVEADTSATVEVDMSTVQRVPAGQETVFEAPTVPMEMTAPPDQKQETAASETVVEDEPTTEALPAEISAADTLAEAGPEPVVIADYHARETQVEADMLLPGTKGEPREITADDTSSITQTAMVEATLEKPAPKRPKRRTMETIEKVKADRRRTKHLVLATLGGILGAILFLALCLYLAGTFDTHAMKLKSAFFRFMYDLERAESTADLLPHVYTDHPYQKQEAEKLFRKWLEQNRVSFERIKIKELVAVGPYGHVKFDVEFFIEDKLARRGSDPDIGTSGATEEIKAFRTEMVSYWLNVKGKWYFDTQKYEMKRMVEEFREALGKPKMAPEFQKFCPVCLKKHIG